MKETGRIKGEQKHQQSGRNKGKDSHQAPSRAGKQPKQDAANTTRKRENSHLRTQRNK